MIEGGFEEGVPSNKSQGTAVWLGGLEYTELGGSDCRFFSAVRGEVKREQIVYSHWIVESCMCQAHDTALRLVFCVSFSFELF